MSAFPTTPVLDDCQRANENPLSQSGAWTGSAHWGAPLQLLDQRIMRSGASFAGSYRTAAVVGNCEFYAQLPILPPALGSFGLAIYQTANISTPDGYEVYFYAGSGDVELYRVTAGAGVLLASATLAQAPMAGDAVGFWRIGHILALYIRQNGAWQWVIAATDATFSGPWHGLIGVEDATVRVDSVGGGLSLLERTTNTTPQTAREIVIDGAEFRETLDVMLNEPPLYEVWYKFTATQDDVLGMWFHAPLASSYDPRTHIFIGPDPDTLTDYLDGFDAINKRLQVPVLAGTTYYIRIRQSGADQPNAPLYVHAKSAPANAISPGQILAHDDEPFYPMILLAPSDGQAVRGFSTFPAGERGEMLRNGTSLWNDEATPDHLALLNRFFERVASPPTQDDDLEYPITSNRSTRFYVARRNGGSPIVQEMDAFGVWGERQWSIGSGTPWALALSPDERILYFAFLTNSAIHRWNLEQNVAMSDLAASIGAYKPSRSMVALADGSVLFGYTLLSPIDGMIKRYSSAGAVLNTYSFGSNAVDQFVRTWDDNDASFWVKQSIGGQEGTSSFSRIRVSDGTVLKTFSLVEFNEGVYGEPATDTPLAEFGPSFSCTFAIVPPGEDIDPPDDDPPDPDDVPFIMPAPPVVTKIPVRVRRAPHLSEEQLTNFYDRIQFDFESGVGLNEIATGYVPRVMVRWSDDGGHTWSQERQLGLGKIGRFKYRTFLNKMGRSRDRVYEVKCSDPVHSRLLAAYLTMTPGTS